MLPDEERNQTRRNQDQETETYKELMDKFSGRKADASEILRQSQDFDEDTSAQDLVTAASLPKKAKFKKTTKTGRFVRGSIKKGKENIKRGYGELHKGKGINAKTQGKLRRLFTYKNSNGDFVSALLTKQQFQKLRTAGVQVHPKINPDTNIFEREHRFQQDRFEDKERSRWNNVEHYSTPLRRFLQHLKELDNQQAFQNDPSVNLLQAHRRMLSEKENTIFNTSRSKNILDVRDNNIMIENPNSINILKADEQFEILQAQNVFSNHDREHNVLNASPLNFGMVELRRDVLKNPRRLKQKPRPQINILRPQSNNKRQRLQQRPQRKQQRGKVKVNNRLSFW